MIEFARRVGRVLKTRAPACLSAFLVLSGCAAVKDAYMVDSLTREHGDHLLSTTPLLLGSQYVPIPFDIYTQPFPGDPDPTSGKEPGVIPDAACSQSKISLNDEHYFTQLGNLCRSAYSYAALGSDTKNRDSLLGFLVQRSDKICHTHEAGIISIGSEANFGLSEITTILAGLGGLFTPAATARALSGAAGLVNATRDNFNQVFFQNLLATAIVKSIETTRVAKRGSILGHVGKDKDTWSIDLMIADVEDYHASCSFYAGMVALTSAAQRVTPSTDEISARIAELVTQRKNNQDQLDVLNHEAFLPTQGDSAKKRDANVAAIVSKNADLTAQIGQLQLQLALVPSSGGAPAIANAATAP